MPLSLTSYLYNLSFFLFSFAPSRSNLIVDFNTTLENIKTQKHSCDFYLNFTDKPEALKVGVSRSPISDIVTNMSDDNQPVNVLLKLGEGITKIISHRAPR
jgi:hypothetical protein